MKGKYEAKVGNRRFLFTQAAFMMAWLGHPRDIAPDTGPRGTKGIEEWLERKGLHEFAAFSITPTILKKAERAKTRSNAPGRFVDLPMKRGGWGGSRTHTRGADDDLEELFAECVEEARRSHSEAPYLRYESQWERANGRKAPRRLLKRFREKIA